MYVAISKEDGSVMSGAKGQHAFGDKRSLASSIGQSYTYTARRLSCKPKDLYDIYEVDADDVRNVGRKI